MEYLKHLVKHYPVSSFYILIIWVLCFATVPSTPLDDVTMIDKWVHIAMYGGTCATIWLEYIRRHDPRRFSQKVVSIQEGVTSKPPTSRLKLFLLAWLAPVVMSGTIEILQANCTGGQTQRRLDGLRRQQPRSNIRRSSGNRGAGMSCDEAWQELIPTKKENGL